MAKYDHTFSIAVGSQTAQFQKLLEHLRYSGSTLLSYRYTRETNSLEAQCRFKGSRRGLDQSIERAKSFLGVTFTDIHKTVG